MLKTLSLAEAMRHGAYQAYSYSYPHKSAYRMLDTPRALDALWATQDRSALFAYVHVPFCTMRCGFCNLFAMALPDDALVDAYVDAVLRQMQVMDRVLGERRFARLALGGGTPSFLSAGQLERLYAGAQRWLGIDLAATPSGIEVSPETVTRERLQVCRAMGVRRVSMGIQSFADAEMRALARPQQGRIVNEAITEIRRAGFEVMNLDLIYGIAGQTAASWLASLESALAFAPEELYLYPLYVRAQTGLGKLSIRQAEASGADQRQALYAIARDRLRAAGYRQVSMRMFRAPHAPQDDGPVYCCQDDGMVGLGAGARSYTSTLHWSGDYAVARAATRSIVENFIAQDDTQFAQAVYGFELDGEEQRRRYVIQSLLTEPGLSLAAYEQRFGSAALDDLPQLQELVALELAHDDSALLALNDRGTAYADTIGPWLASARVQEGMASDAC
ncbi:STM4012 family radical SAM protein [Acidovorax sp. Leaf78]|uniref:STM4012 family radical SAM protein n=1 Tax=Acidovorax sp. Leaf78 TaxID=1736237 RepID=UPI0006FB72B3|nr:STM4012 family radical SAM protein [Acidovorax sp. Leaf78]KQO27214.1 coproporphyrinogen III oxidase [Acidovorax sp. Leaf78]